MSFLTRLYFVAEQKEFKAKRKKIEKVLAETPVSQKALKELAISDGGLIDDSLRKDAWPLLLGLTDLSSPPAPSEEDLKAHPEYQQVVLDVNRSLKRFPPGIPLEQRLSLQNQLTRLILRVVLAHPRLRYYQGYHDVAVTLLLVTGENAAFFLLEYLSMRHLKDCMEPTMEKTSHLLNYIYPLVRHQNAEVYEQLEKSGVGTMFALPWFLTWFGHSLSYYKDVVRLYDYFLATEPLSPLYLSSVMVVHRAQEILMTPCDMASMHSLLSHVSIHKFFFFFVNKGSYYYVMFHPDFCQLSKREIVRYSSQEPLSLQIPDDLPFEKLLRKTSELYQKYPPEEVEGEVRKRVEEEHRQRHMEMVLRQARLVKNIQNGSAVWRWLGRIDPVRRLPLWGFPHPHHIPQALRRYRYLMATAFAVGVYAIYMQALEGR